MGGASSERKLQRPEAELAFVVPRLRGEYWASGKNPRSGAEYDVVQPVDEAGFDILGGRMADQLKKVVGNGLAKISVGMDVGHKDYGRGGGCSVMVSLTHDQSVEGVYAASSIAGELAAEFCREHVAKAQALYDEVFGE